MSPGRKGNEMNKARKEVAIPEVAERHVKIECGKVARRFHLNDDDREELESHVGCEVRLAVAGKYDPRKGKVYTFVQRIVHYRLCKWMNEEYRRREDFRRLAVEEARRKAKRQLAKVWGQNDSLDDTTYGDDERWDRGEQLPVICANEETPWDPSGERRLLVIARVRQTVGRMKKGESKSLLNLYLKCETLTEVYERMRARRRNGLGTARFYGEMWPKARRDFIREWTEVEKCFDPLG